MVGEVVHDEHPADLPAQLLAPPHAGEVAKPRAISSGSSPSARAAATTPSAFSTLWAPPTGSARDPERAAALQDREAGALRPEREVARGVVGAGRAGPRRSRRAPCEAAARSAPRSGTPRRPRGSPSGGSRRTNRSNAAS